MGWRRALGATPPRDVASALVLVGLWGCAALPPNSFLDPTKVGRFASHEGEIRRILSPKDAPPGLPNATDPTPEDLVPVYEDYRIGPGDTVAVSIQDLLTPGQPFIANYEVSSVGEIRIPEAGSIRVAGLTEGEVERELAARLKEAGVLVRPSVQAFTQVRRGRMFSIMGAVGASGPYPISDPDLRLLEAIGMAGDVAATVRRVYVIRRAGTGRVPRAAPPAPEVSPKEDLIIPPPVEDNGAPQGGLMTAGGMRRQETSPAATRDAPTKEDLTGIIAPPATQTRPATRQVEELPRAPFEPLIFDPQTGRVIEVERPAKPAVEKPAPAERAPQESRESLEQPFDWESVEEHEAGQRVISIDVGELKSGNPRYNIVVRGRDVINVPTDTGVFYMMGEISRPGPYAFGGRDITIKQAVATAGGFTPLAWPQRCEIIRREAGTDKQITIPANLDAIFAGLEPDFYLKDDDIVNVGTHVVAPFLYVVRNSFRFTYGFGFVYDRNFADQDAYSARANPAEVRRAQRAARGLPF